MPAPHDAGAGRMMRAAARRPSRRLLSGLLAALALLLPAASALAQVDFNMWIEAAKTEIIEGQSVLYTIHTDRDTPGGSLSVDVTVEPPEGFGLRTGFGSKTLEFMPNDQTDRSTVITTKNSNISPDGELVISIGEINSVGDINWVLGVSSVTVTVKDDDTTMSITTENAQTREGDTVTFTLTATPDLTHPRSVPVTFEKTNGFITTDDRLTIELDADNSSRTFSTTIETNDDVNGDGVLSVKMSRGAWTNGDSMSRPIVDDDNPISASPETPQVIEGNPVVFTLTSQEPFTSARFVPVNLLGGDGFSPTVTPGGVQFAAGETEKTVTVSTTKNPNAVADESLRVEPVASTDWAVGAVTPVTILDNDTTISISTLATQVIEGESVVFTLTADSAFPSARTVPVNFTPSDEFSLDGTPAPAQFAAGSSTATVIARIADDDVSATGNGTLRAELTTGAWTIGTPSSATVTLQDNEGEPDVNADGAVNANDALILYYAYSLSSSLGNGR